MKRFTSLGARKSLQGNGHEGVVLPLAEKSGFNVCKCLQQKKKKKGETA
ncbi:MAG: hypothetical protein PHI97_03475 [Desulfobulbus sp.]|nr:hypothetical protein [Desulfobulbus sp.]